MAHHVKVIIGQSWR